MQPSNTELILIRVTGEDRPGLTASVTEILAKYDATILISARQIFIIHYRWEFCSRAKKDTPDSL